MPTPQYDALPANEQGVVDRKDLDPDIRESWIEVKKRDGDAAWQECLSLTSDGFPQLPYEVKRRRAYAALSDQLDMIYHDQVDSTTTWRDHIAAVKAAHPKT